MKKLLTVLLSMLLVAAMLLSFAACGDKKTEEKADDETEATTTADDETEEPSDDPADEPSTEEPSDEPDAPAEPDDESAVALSGVMYSGSMEYDGGTITTTLTLYSDGTFASVSSADGVDAYEYNGTFENTTDSTFTLYGTDGEVGGVFYANEDGTFALESDGLTMTMELIGEI